MRSKITEWSLSWVLAGLIVGYLGIVAFEALAANETPSLKLELIEFNDLSKHLVENRNFQRLDVVITPRIQLTQYPAPTTPPEMPNEGDTYIVPAGATGDWLNHDSEIVYYNPDGVWEFIEPQPMWQAEPPRDDMYSAVMIGGLIYKAGNWVSDDVKSYRILLVGGFANGNEVSVASNMVVAYDGSASHAIDIRDAAEAALGELKISSTSKDGSTPRDFFIEITDNLGAQSVLITPVAKSYFKQGINTESIQIGGVDPYTGTIPAGSALTVQDGVIMSYQ